MAQPRYTLKHTLQVAHANTCRTSLLLLLLPAAAAVKCVEVAATDWFSATADFQKRFDTQLKQELADHGSSVTGGCPIIY